MKKELLYVLPIAGMMGLPLVNLANPRITIHIEGAKKTLAPGQSSKFIVKFKNNGDKETTVKWQAIAQWGSQQEGLTGIQEFKIGAKEEKSVSGVFVAKDTMEKHYVDLIINYWYESEGETETEEVSYKEKYGEYPYYVREAIKKIDIVSVDTHKKELIIGLDNFEVTVTVKNSGEADLHNVTVEVWAIPEESPEYALKILFKQIDIKKGQTITLHDYQPTQEGFPQGYWSCYVKVYLGTDVEHPIAEKTIQKAWYLRPYVPPKVKVVGIEVY